MEDTDSDIIGLGFLITSSLMWISNRGHVFRNGGIILHPSGVFSNVLMQEKRHVIRKTSDTRNDGSISTLMKRVIKETMNNYHMSTCFRLYDRQ